MSSFKQHCYHCAKDTAQTPSSVEHGYVFTCDVCKQQVRTLSTADMMTELARKFAMGPPFEVSSADAKSVKVIVKHHLGEAEASLESVQLHMRITGELPTPGKPLLALPNGMNHKAFAIPIAEVIRLERVQ